MVMFWVAILAISILLYVLLDGFDLGVGMLFGLTHDETRRHAMMSAIAPMWDGNETWLIVAAVVLWGAFPVVYATLLSAFYLPVLLASGDLLVLERKFSLLSGVGIRIRRIALAAIAPGALVDGPAIFNADLGQEIDNMEGIDAHVTPEGDTVLTLVSDDNFSMIQRTLLLQFTLMQ